MCFSLTSLLLEPSLLNLPAGCSCVCPVGQLGENWFWASEQLPVTLCPTGSLSCHPQEGTVSPGGTAVTLSLHPTAPLLALGKGRALSHMK